MPWLQVDALLTLLYIDDTLVAVHSTRKMLWMFGICAVPYVYPVSSICRTNLRARLGCSAICIAYADWKPIILAGRGFAQSGTLALGIPMIGFGMVSTPLHVLDMSSISNLIRMSDRDQLPLNKAYCHRCSLGFKYPRHNATDTLRRQPEVDNLRNKLTS